MNWSRLQRGLSRRIDRIRPFRTTTCGQLAAAHPDCWREVHPAWRAAWPAQLPSGELPACLRDRLTHSLPARGVLELRDAVVLGDHGWVFTAEGRVVVDTSAFADAEPWMPRMRRPLLSAGATRLRGRTLSLLSNWSSTNFYHMLCESIPRVQMVFAAGWRWEDFDRILLPATCTPTIRRMLEQLGLPGEKCLRVEWGQRNHFRVDELVCTSFLGGRRTVLPMQIDYLRGLYSPRRGNEERGRRIFVRRRARTRHIRNEAELVALLEARGFAVVDPGELSNAEDVFHAADFVVGAHGAGLANLVFCRPGTKVLELLPTDQPFPYFFTVSVHGGLHYDCLICPSDRVQPMPHPFVTWNSPSDFTVEVAAFAEALDRLLENPGETSLPIGARARD